MTDPRNVVVARNTYDANGRVIEQLQADGGRWTFSYVLVNAGMPSSPVQETTVTDPLGHATIYRLQSGRIPPRRHRRSGVWRGLAGG